jgi:acyl dehydratase
MPSFFDSALRVNETRMAVNYGVNKVRFTSPVPVGSRLRARILLQSADPIEPKGFQMVYSVTVEREGSDKPVCVAETIARRYA